MTPAEYAEWKQHPVTVELRKRLQAAGEALAVEIVREIAETPDRTHRASWWQGYTAGISAWLEESV